MKKKKLLNNIKIQNCVFKEYIEEPILNLFISYQDMKTKYPIGIIDLRHRLDHITPKKIQLILDYGTDSDNIRLFLILITRRETELFGDEDKIIDVKNK